MNVRSTDLGVCSINEKKFTRRQEDANEKSTDKGKKALKRPKVFEDHGFQSLHMKGLCKRTAATLGPSIAQRLDANISDPEHWAANIG